MLEKGFIHGSEHFYNVEKTVENDLRFFWTSDNKQVTVGN